MFQLSTTPGRTCRINRENFLFFSGYAYLGMNHVKGFIENVNGGIKKYGVLYPSSRISNTRLQLYEKLERRLSTITGTEETVSFSSGFLAGQTAASLLSSHKNIFTAPGTHPALHLPSTHTSHATNREEWKAEVVKRINGSLHKEFVVLSDSVDIMNARLHDFSFLENIRPAKNIILLVDDSHGIGITGKGRGISHQLPRQQNIELILCYSLSKAFGIEGGAVSCSLHRAAQLRKHSNYTGSTAINPALAHAFLQSASLYEKQLEKLMANIGLLREQLPGTLYQHSFDLPIFICRDSDAADNYFRNKIIISSFGYPDPRGPKINRVVINALHRDRDIRALIHA